MTRIATAIAAGVSALAKQQRPDGSFPLATVTPPGHWRDCDPVFSTACVLLAVGSRLSPDSMRRATAYLRSARRPDGLWAFDRSLDIPPDADTTACALAALAHHAPDADLHGGAALLRTFWRAPEGPFRTWPDTGMWAGSGRDDAVVNGNVVLALDELGAPASHAEIAAVERLIAKRVDGPRYYVSACATAYAARRAGLRPDRLPSVTTAQPPPGDVLGCAQWILGTGRRDPVTIDAIVNAQRGDGSWPRLPWCKAAQRPVPYWGSEAVTTAIAIEALAGA
ncbi:MAG: hypothetical protein ACHQJ7_11115 [Vicinamibacteria bacterium]|jgi:hypothetical protein